MTDPQVDSEIEILKLVGQARYLFVFLKELEMISILLIISNKYQ